MKAQPQSKCSSARKQGSPKPTLASLQEEAKNLHKIACDQSREICDFVFENRKLKKDLRETLDAGDALARVAAYALAHFRLGFKKTEKEDFQKAFQNWVAHKTALLDNKKPSRTAP